MDLKTFGSLYNLKEASIIDIYNINNDLVIKCVFDFYQEFMANGCRSDFDYEESYEFIFNDCDINIKKDNLYKINDFKYLDNSLLIIINNKEYIIKSREVIINKL